MPDFRLHALAQFALLASAFDRSALETPPFKHDHRGADEPAEYLWPEW